MIVIGSEIWDGEELNEDGERDVPVGTQVRVYEMRVKFESC
jgi:hypothetical protein